MYQLYDSDFSVEYTEADEVIVKLKGEILVYEVVKGLSTEKELTTAAIKMLTPIYPQPIYYSVQDVATLFDLHRGSVDYVLTNNMVQGYHYIAIGAKKFVTEQGIKVIAKKYKKKEEQAL